MATSVQRSRFFPRLPHTRQRLHLSTFSLHNSIAAQRFGANGTLPYTPLAIYEIIADIDSYPEFIPYITSSRVLEWSQPDTHYKRSWPQFASLRVGYGHTINEEFTSRLFCAPPVPANGFAGIGIIEAVSGASIQTHPQIPSERIAHHRPPRLHRGFSSVAAAAEDSPLEFLRTRWTLHALPENSTCDRLTTNKPKLEMTCKLHQQRTEVTLSIEYKFRSRLYDMMSSAVAPRIAENMLSTFERRIQNVLGKC